MKKIPCYLVDAFSDKPFAGNGAAVCVLSSTLPDAQMALIAREMNQSETAFVLPENDGFSLRWFTPAVEVDLCGHATLASAHVLWHNDTLPKNQPALFHTRSGILSATCQGALITLDFPQIPVQPVTPPAQLVTALGIAPLYSGIGKDYFLFEIASADELRKLQPDFAGIARCGAAGVMVTSTSTNPDFDFISRFFAPLKGVNEDPVTGSAHCRLAPYWAQKLGKTNLTAYQASQRGGILQLRLEHERVFISGHACIVASGQLYVPESA